MVTNKLEPRNEIRSMIARVRWRWTMQMRLRAAGVALAAGSVPPVAARVVTNARSLEGLPLMGVMFGAVAAMAVVAGVCLWRVRCRPSNRQVARFIEERVAATGDASLNDELVSAVEIAESGESASGTFGRLILDRAARRLRTVGPDAIVPPPAFRSAAWAAAGGAACFLLALVATAPAIERATDAARVQFFPGTVHVEVLPGDARIAAGATLRVRAVVRGNGGPLERIAPVITMVSGAARQSVAMAPAGDAFEYEIPAIDRTFSYHVSAGHARSADYTVTALFPPRVARIDLIYAYPAFTGLASRTEEDGGDIYAPAGTRVRLRIHATKPVTRGELTFAGAPAIPLRVAGDAVFEADVVLVKDDSYRVGLGDRDGLQSRGESEYFIRLMNDRPPEVRILRPSADQQITPLEEIAIEARADDDYGIAAFDLVFAVGGGAGRRVEFKRVTGTASERVGSTVLSAEALGVKPGDVISYYARARDVGRGKRPTQATSDIFFLEVKPFSEEFASAQSQAGGRAGGAQIDSLVEAQKQIIASTWNIERRSAAGRSSEDVRTVAEAQSSLKARAQRMSSNGMRRPGRVPAPQRVSQAPQAAGGSDPIAAAVEAMSRAMEQLETERTREALPHEMAALNGLLQAQAEVRRREVARQQANGSGNAGNRASQDLSALFDKELQRQQQTNYETQPAAETREDPAESDGGLLERLRDLAKRQEDLSRRQSDLAKKTPSSDNLRRQLEQLTREQTELRQQAEDLARRLGNGGEDGRRPQRGGSFGSSSDSGAAWQGSRSVREAADSMQAAANGMRRDDMGAAGQSAARAAEQLRRLEERMGRGTPEGRQRAGGDLQVKAQQIAQEQRRIAAEADRLDRSAAGAADARKRLADEKGRLAERVDELKRAATLAREGSGEASASPGVPRDLDVIAQRMRDSARAMRAAGPGQSDTARAEQDLARDAERVAGRLSSGGSAEERQLSAQLEQTRALRDRLQRLDGQMRDAARGGNAASRTNPGPRGQGDAGGRPGGAQSAELDRLREQYRQELGRARQALDKLASAQPASSSGGGTPEDEQFSRAAPGTEAFKQDRSDWASLRKDLDLALEKYEAAVSSRLSGKAAKDRFSAGGSERVPDGYQQPIARYFESLASVKKEKK
jgi:hypothetical protein